VKHGGTFHGHTPENVAYVLPAEPTQALPGTLAKVAAMEERAKRGEALFHPADGDWEL
jgi:hypothetical protein